MPVIDSHQHFWKYHPDNHGWINDDMSVIRKDFLPGDLLPLLQQNDIEGCVAVQADQSQKETDFLIELAAANPFIKGVVGWVNLRAADSVDRLAYYSAYPIVKGFRHILQGEDPAFMLQPDFLRGISALQAFGFTYDILIYPAHLEASLQLVKHFPEQSFVIDHLAKPDIKNGVIGNWKKGIESLAALPNVFCKVSGMVTEADWKGWKKEDLFPYLDVVSNAFGVNRLLYGSDWPVCLVASSYQQMLAPVRDYFSKFSAAEQEMVFGKNAINFYHL
ncbi:MAG: amidohydrolase family protein [Sediminibacterium sp.]